jgi:hypothetical protein
LTGLFFVSSRLYSSWSDLDFSEITPSIWAQAFVVGMIYGVGNFLLALAWRNLLNQFNDSVTHLAAIRIYGISQIAKYIPGNIFHIAGRQLLGVGFGISAMALAKSAILELIGMALVGSLFFWLMLPLLFSGNFNFAGAFLFVFSILFIAAIIKTVFGGQLLYVFAYYLLFLALSGSLFIFLLNLFTDIAGFSFFYKVGIGGAYIFAWLVGFLAPGSPAGLGVRETVLLLLLDGVVIERHLLMAILLGRMVTIGGDLIFFVSTYFVPVRPHGNEKLMREKSGRDTALAEQGPSIGRGPNT